MDPVTIRRLTAEEETALGVHGWPVWSCGVSSFPWHYDQAEECLILAGEVTVKTAGGEYRFGAGDFVRFAAGLDCTWDVRQAVRKHYRFID
jgi:uncharacterized cupin superfamily protein